MKRDYIGWWIGILGIILSLIFGLRNKELEDNKQQIYNHAQNIQQYITYNNYSLPETIGKELQSIEVASGPTVMRK